MPTKQKPKSKALATTNGNGMSLQHDQMAVMLMSVKQFEILHAKTPDYAIQTRPGPGGQTFKYLKTAYVETRLDAAFGADWDWEPIPMEEGRLFVERQRGEIVYLCETGKLTVRIRDPKSLEVITTITKVGQGSQVWNKNTEFGDSLKGADSDALKRAARKLGIGADLAWDDQAEIEKHETRQQLKNGFVVVDADQPPTNLVQLITRSGLGIDELCTKLQVADVGEIKDFADAWQKVKPE